MSYESTVIANGVDALWRLDEDVTSHGTLVDASGNGRHATCYTTAPSHVHGMASPIETDANSRAMNGFIGRYAPTGVADRRTGFAWQTWGYASPGAPRVLLCRSGHPSLSNSNIIFINSSGNSITARLRINGVSYDLTKSITANAWYYIVVVYTGSTILLYVNGVLADQETGVTGDMEVGSATEFRIGNFYDNVLTVWSSAGSDEVAIGPVLSAADVLENYEAALATLPLRATITINLGLELNTDQIVPTNLGFPHNYSQTFGDGQVPIVEELEYRTNVNQSEPDYQQRISARPHGALRSLEYHISPNSGGARSRFHGALYTPAQFYCVPVWSDFGLTTDVANSGTNTIPVDTTKRDYEALSYCGTCTDPQDPTTYQFFQISAVADAQLTLASNIGTTIPSGSIVFPARVASISEDSLAVKSFAADHEDTVIRFELIESELSTRRITAYTPSTTYLSTEVFTLETARVQWLDDRPYDLSRRIQGRGRDYQYAVDTGSPQTFPVRFLLTSRSALSDFYGWLDARQGKLNPLFVSSKESDYTVLARPSGATLTVRKAGFSFHYGRRHLEILKTDGTFSRLRLTAITDNGDGTETLTGASSFPLLADISKVSFLKFCTLAQDSIQIRYWKGGGNGVIAESTVSFRELLTSPA